MSRSERLRRRLRRAAPGPAAAVRHDAWLRAAAGSTLDALDAACAAGGHGGFAPFRELDDELWALLLTQEYDGFPHIRALLPGVPDPALQALYNGRSGVALATQSLAFYRRLRARFAQYGPCPLPEARVLDFGCGWGRLTRYLARDVAAGRLFGCDPVEPILDVCRATRVPATLARSDFVPERLPFAERFELAFAFSVFTHLSEPAHAACLDALHAGLVPGGVLVVTVRPPAYLGLADGTAEYVFRPHPAEPSHPQWGGGAMTYGETVVPLAYVRERWAPRFELLATDVALDDLFQVVLTLRRA